MKWGGIRQLFPTERGVLYVCGVETAGYGLIETMRVRDGRIPFLERHLARLARSLGELGLARPARDVAGLVTPFAETGNAVLRVEVCDGRATVTVRELPPLDPPAVLTASEPHERYPHKTTQRDCFVDAALEAEVGEADDALLLTPDGWVAEGTVWNVFWWEGERLCTPAEEVGILPGIGRARVLELVTGVEQGRYPEQALAGKSLFLTNAVRGIVPIASLDGVPVPADPRTADFAQRFWATM